jgi:beta-lactamase regulating signal transducer with metallopeptidase domain
MLTNIFKSLFAGLIVSLIWFGIAYLAVITIIPYFYKDSYISVILTSHYDSNEIKSILANFNKLGYNKIIRLTGTRPIYITDGALTFPLLGQTYRSLDKCIIVLASHLNKEELRLVVVHEYNHCFGYNHTKIRGDLMYKGLIEGHLPSEANIKEWAVKLCLFLNGKNNCN